MGTDKRAWLSPLAVWIDRSYTVDLAKLNVKCFIWVAININADVNYDKMKQKQKTYGIFALILLYCLAQCIEICHICLSGMLLANQATTAKHHINLRWQYSSMPACRTFLTDKAKRRTYASINHTIFACCLFGTTHYLNQWWFIVDKAMRNI